MRLSLTKSYMGVCCCKTHETLRQNNYDDDFGRSVPPPTAHNADHTDRLVLDALRAVRRLVGK